LYRGPVVVYEPRRREAELVAAKQLGRLLQRQGFQLRKLRLPDGSEVDAFEKTFEVQ
jgi:hypothetical protein